jgi:large conductance mechanosensitive channel
LKGFVDFIREQGVVGLAVGFILGGAVAKVVTAVVTDIVTPIIGLIIGSAKGLESASFGIGKNQIMYGHFISSVIDFAVIAAVVYFGIKALKLDKLDKKKA